MRVNNLVIASPSPPVILSETKNLGMGLRINSAKQSHSPPQIAELVPSVSEESSSSQLHYAKIIW